MPATNLSEKRPRLGRWTAPLKSAGRSKETGVSAGAAVMAGFRVNHGVGRNGLISSLPHFEGPFRIPPASAGVSATGLPTERPFCLHRNKPSLSAITFMAATSSAERQRIILPIVESAGQHKSLPTPAAAHVTMTMAELAHKGSVTLSSVSSAARQLLLCQSNQVSSSKRISIVILLVMRTMVACTLAEDLGSPVQGGVAPSGRCSGHTSESPQPGMRATGICRQEALDRPQVIPIHRAPA